MEVEGKGDFVCWFRVFVFSMVYHHGNYFNWFCLLILYVLIFRGVISASSQMRVTLNDFSKMKKMSLHVQSCVWICCQFLPCLGVFVIVKSACVCVFSLVSDKALSEYVFSYMFEDKKNIHSAVSWGVQEVHSKRSHKFLRKNRRSKHIFSLQKHSCEVHVKCVFLSALLSK